MFGLFKKIVKTGVVTTAYPATPDIPAPGFRGLPEWTDSRCKGCGRCVLICPAGAIKLDKSAKSAIFWTIDPKKCLFCGFCVDHCPGQALSPGYRYELAEVAGGDGNKRTDTVNNLFGRSVHIRHLDSGSCNACDWEMTTLTGPVYDLQRLGFDFVASPRHADILMVTGPVTRNLEIAATKTFNATPAPKSVVAVGTCACSGGICGKNYASAGGVDKLLPVNTYIPGCPPRPQALIQGLLLAVGRWDTAHCLR